MRFFFHSREGDALFLARRFVLEGHAVSFYTEEPRARFGGHGLVPQVTSQQPKKGDVVVFDQVHNGARGDALRKLGFPVVGASRFADRLELDRSFGTLFMERCGIAVPETVTFRRLPDAIRFLEQENGEFFFKASGNQQTCLTHNAPDSEAMIRFLRWVSSSGMLKGASEFALQRKVDGIEISTECWFDGSAFVPPWNSTLEDKHFLTGDVGPRIGCAGNFVWCWPDRPPFLSPAVVGELERRLRTEHYVGPLDLNAILDDDGIPHGLEWTARFGYDGLQGFSALIDDFGEKLAALAQGSLTEWDVRDVSECALTLGLSVPPYPTESHDVAAKQRGLPLPSDVLSPNVCVSDVMIEDDAPVLAGYDGVIGSVVAVGRSAPQLRASVLAQARSLEIPSLQYRTDPVLRIEHTLRFIEDRFGSEYLPRSLRSDALYDELKYTAVEAIPYA